MYKFILLTAIFAITLSRVYTENEGGNDAADDAKDKVQMDAKDAAPSNATAEQELDIYDKAVSCPHRFHMGCLLDVVEKSCTGLQTIESCANTGKCKNVEELQRIIGAFDPTNFEAINKCCCSKAFTDGGYEDCKTPDPVCMKAIDDHVNTELKENVKLLKACLKKKEKSVCKKAIDAVNWAREAVQKARGEMWPTEGCQILAPPQPLSKCGFDVKPEGRAIERPDLYCDTIIWQYKEMGAVDPFMAQCKDAPKVSEQKKEPMEGEEQEEEGEFEEGEEPEVMGGEGDEEGDEAENPDGEGAEQDMEDMDEGAQMEGDGKGGQGVEEDSDGEESQYMKDEL